MISGNPNNPSLVRNPALSGTLLGAFNFAIDKIIQGLDGRLPASVISYNRMTNLAEVQILIPYVTTGGDIIPRAQIAAVPVQMDGGGGIFISFPLQPGDLGWIEACDRDISLFLQTYQITQPNSFRKWSFSDGKFTPSTMKGYTINVQDNGAAVISTLDGTVRIAISQEGVTITSPTLTINGNLAVSGNTVLQGYAYSYTNITAAGTVTGGQPPP